MQICKITERMHKKEHSKWHNFTLSWDSDIHTAVLWSLGTWDVGTYLPHYTASHSQDTIILFTSLLSAQWTIPQEYTPTIGSHKTQKWDILDSQWQGWCLRCYGVWHFITGWSMP